MKRLAYYLFVYAVIASNVTLMRAQDNNYLWLTDRETSPDGTRHPWPSGDTIYGDIRSNDTIAIIGHPVFYGHVITSAPDFWRGPGYNPEFVHPPSFNAPRMNWPNTAEDLRNGAAMQGNFHHYPDKACRAYFTGRQVHMYRWERGTEFDPRDNWLISIAQGGPETPGTCIFVDGPLEILGDTTTNGAFSGKVTIGASGNIRIMDNLRYVSSSFPQGWTSPESNDLLGIISEGDIIIGNTPANGRWNSGMPNGTSGNLQSNPRRTDITLTAFLISTNGSFTFEQQNDPDEWYNCDCQPDDRGMIYLCGAVWQRERGDLHRSTNFSTGYLLELQWDSRFALKRPPCFYMSSPIIPNTDTLDFGNVAVGATVWDTAHVYSIIPVNIGLVMANYPYYAVRPEPMYNSHFRIPVRFTPPRAERFVGSLSVSLPGNFLQIVLLGHGVSAAAPPLTVDIAPNPFNSVTTIRYTLQQAGAVRLVLYDVLGRQVREVINTSQEAGAQVVRMDASNLASGVYFVRLETSSQQVMHKLLLLK